MNTKQYMAMFARLAENNEIPRDLYDKMLAEIAQKGKMTKSIYNDYLTELERRGLFDVDGAPYTTEKSAQTDGVRVPSPQKSLLAFYTLVLEHNL